MGRAEISNSRKLLAPQDYRARGWNWMMGVHDSGSPGGEATLWGQEFWRDQPLQKWGIRAGSHEGRHVLASSSHSLTDHHQGLPMVSNHQVSLGSAVSRARAGQQVWVIKWMDWDRAVSLHITNTENTFLRTSRAVQERNQLKSSLVALGTITHSLTSEFCFSSDSPILSWPYPVTPDKEKQNVEDFVVVNFVLPPPLTSSLTLGVTKCPRASLIHKVWKLHLMFSVVPSGLKV